MGYRLLGVISFLVTSISVVVVFVNLKRPECILQQPLAIHTTPATSVPAMPVHTTSQPDPTLSQPALRLRHTYNEPQYALEYMTITCPKSVRKPGTERSINSIVHGLFNEHLVPTGHVLDVGALHGDWSCMYACYDESRSVVAMDPTPSNIADMTCPQTRDGVAGHIIKMVSAIGEKHGSNMTAGFTGHKGMQTVPVTNVDTVFKGSKAGFMHIDVEGFELEALIGANHVLTHDRPIFSFELHIGHPKQKTLLDLVASHKYSAYMVMESCGINDICRNFLSFPNELHISLSNSPTLDIARRGGVLEHVTAENVEEVFRRTRKTALSWRDNTRFDR